MAFSCYRTQPKSSTKRPTATIQPVSDRLYGMIRPSRLTGRLMHSATSPLQSAPRTPKAHSSRTPNSLRLSLLHKPALHLCKRLHGEIIPLTLCRFSSFHQKGLTQARLTRSDNVGTTISHHHAVAQFDVKFLDSAAQHPDAGLAILVLSPVYAYTMLRMIRTMVDGIELNSVLA